MICRTGFRERNAGENVCRLRSRPNSRSPPVRKGLQTDAALAPRRLPVAEVVSGEESAIGDREHCESDSLGTSRRECILVTVMIRLIVKQRLLVWLLGMLLSGCGSVFYAGSPMSGASILRQVDANGVSTWAVLPPSYDPRLASPWIIYNHGFGEDINWILTHAPESSLVQALVQAGFVVTATEYRNIDCWGNAECAEDIANLQALWRSKLSLAPQPFVVGESMGGIVTWNAISHGTLRPVAAVGIYPACSLAAMYANETFAPSIQVAYGFTSSSEYPESTSGFDPLLSPPSKFAGFPIQIWASYSDRVVVRSQNEDAFAHGINAAGGEVIIHTSLGDHGDPSNFDAPAVISFFRNSMHH